MFSFGENYHFDQGTARRLVGDVPLEWWVIDLADGLRPEVSEESKTIRIEDIVSTPMLAIWKGISAYPWQGPPPVSMKGFGSIIFQSTMRPELDPTVATKMTAKNYFLISKNFCNLSVRLGYHYALIEAYLSDLLTESYVTFRFKGGAADLQRKAVRAKLLADVLQHYDFRVELRSDALLARIKKESMEFLEQRLQILGYLTLHARQIDMVMDQKHTVQKYKNKFYTEIDAMLAAQPLPKEASDGPEQKDPAC
jgi:pyruvate,water dikinase